MQKRSINCNFSFILTIILLNSCVTACMDNKSNQSSQINENLSSEMNINNSDQLDTQMVEIANNTIQVIISPSSFKFNSISTADLIIQNNSLDTVSYGKHVKLEKLVDNNWIDTHAFDHFAFEDIELYSLPNSERKYKVMLGVDDYTYEPGTYRIPKKLWTVEKGSQTEMYRYAIFQVQ